MGFPLAAQSRVTSEPCKAFVLWGVARNKGDSCSVCLPGKRKMEFVIYFLLKQYLNFVSKNIDFEEGEMSEIHYVVIGEL